MAILIREETVCEICGLTIQTGEDAYLFPAFAENPQDRLFSFSDGAFHEKCVMGDPSGFRAVELMAERKSKVGPGNRKCQVCGQEILYPDDCAMVDFICLPEDHRLGAFNFTHLHRSHADLWPRKAEFLSELVNAGHEGRISRAHARRILQNLGLSIPEDC